MSLDALPSGRMGKIDKSVYRLDYGTLKNPISINVDSPQSSFDVNNLRGGNINSKDFLSSSDFLTGVSGWAINGDGSVEFNNGYFRGDISAATGTFTGSVNALSGVIGGFTITSTSLYGGIIKTAATVGAGSTGVIMDTAGLRGYDSVLGNTFNLPTNGDAPTFSSGVINETVFEISTNAILRTSSTVGDGSANSAGILINDTAFYATGSNQTLANANVKILTTGVATFSGTVNATAGYFGDGSTRVAVEAAGITIGTTGSIRGGQTAYNTGIGFWLGYTSGKYKLSIGDPAGDHLYWDGTNLTISGSASLVGTLPWSSITDDGHRPANDATVGATWGTNLNSIPATLGAPAGSGLFLSSSNMGYYTGGTWKTYIDSSGNLILGDIAGGNAGLSWSQAGATLTIKGALTATSGAVGGWTLGATSLKDTAGVVGMSSAVTIGDDIRFWAGNVTPGSAPFRVTEAGLLTASSATISGTVTATSGAIGSFSIGTYLYSGSKTAYNDANAGVHLGSDGLGIGNNIFTVSSAGALVAKSATIGNWTVNTTSIFTGTEDHSGYTTNAGDITIYSDGADASIHAKNFYIDTAGSITATSATLTGALGTTAGSAINGIYIDFLTASKISAGTITSQSITLALADGTGDVKIQGGAKTDFTTIGNGFILGMDDSDANKAKFYIGDENQYLYWDGASMVMQGSLNVSYGLIGGWVMGNTSLADAAGLTGMSSAVTIGDDIRFWAGNVTPSSAPFKVTEAGVLTATSATITGAITATSGTIGGFTIDSTEGLYAGAGVTRVQMKTGVGIWTGATAIGSAPFSVTNAGVLKSTSGTIGGWTLGATSLTAGTGGTTTGVDSGGTNPAFYAGSATPTTAPFRVTQAGALTATSATITGTVNATAGVFTGNLTLGNGTTVSGTLTLSIADTHGDTYIAAGKTDYVNTVAGFILGLDDSDSNLAKFYIGNSSTYLNWTGSALNILGASITGGTIQTATSGKRIVISGNQLDAYDAGGTHRFSISNDDSNGSILFYNSVGTLKGGIIASDLSSGSGSISIAGVGGYIYFNQAIKTNGSVYPEVDAGVESGISVQNWSSVWTRSVRARSGYDLNLYAGAGANIYANQSILPSADNIHRLGATNDMWNAIFVRNVLATSGSDLFLYSDIGRNIVVGSSFGPNAGGVHTCGFLGESWKEVWTNSVSADDGEDLFLSAGAGYNIYCDKSIAPLADNIHGCGLNIIRWADVWTVKLNGADIGLANGWKLREYPATKEDIHKPIEWMKKHANKGIQILDDNEKVIAVIHKNGYIYCKGVRPLEELDKE